MPTVNSDMIEPLILIADDEPVNRMSLEKILKIDGNLILTAENGVRALELFKENFEKISACLVDINMPELDGLSLIRKIREMSTSIPVFLLTGEDGAVTEEIRESLGIQEVFIKPFNWDRLRTVVRTIITSSQ